MSAQNPMKAYPLEDAQPVSAWVSLPDLFRAADAAESERQADLLHIPDFDLIPRFDCDRCGQPFKSAGQAAMHRERCS